MTKRKPNDKREIPPRPVKDPEPISATSDRMEAIKQHQARMQAKKKQQS